MRVIIFTDTHGSDTRLEKIKEKIKKNNVELAVCAGDMTTFEDHLDTVLFKFNELSVPVILIHGNHEGAEKVKLYTEMFENLTFIHRETYEKEGVLFMGYGGGGFEQTDRIFRRISKKFKKAMKTAGKSVLVVHQPPYDTKLDELIDGHHGNKDFTDFIKDSQPDIVICGHFHENNGKEDFIGTTRIINPGHDGRIIQL